MEMYNAAVEVATKKEPTAAAVDTIMDQLEHHHGAVGMSPRGWLQARISLPAEDLVQASVTAVALVQLVLGAPAISCEVMTEAEFLAREGWEPVADLVSVTEAAQLLGVSRQAVLDRINRKTLPAEKVGREYVIPRSAVSGSIED